MAEVEKASEVAEERTEASPEKKAPARKAVKKEVEPPKDFASAVRLSESGKVGDALPFLKEFASNESLNAEAWRELGIALFRADQFEEAVEPLETATRLSPQDSKAWFYLGAVYRENKRPWDAETAYVKLLDLEPDHPQAPDDLKGVRIALSILRAQGRLTR